MANIDAFLITEGLTVRQAMKRMNEAGEKALFIIDKNKKLLGSLTDGDIRRWILQEGSIKERVRKVYNNNPIFVKTGYDKEAVKKIMLSNHIEWIPVVDNNKVVVEVLLWGNFFGDKIAISKDKLDVPVVIMGGGEGERLSPFTQILPKPLIPINGKPVIDIIMDKFRDFGAKDFYVSIHYKSKIIKAYFEEKNSKYRTNYLEENQPLGTAGGLRLLCGKIDKTFFVVNCDTVINSDYTEILNFHRENKSDITIVGSLKHYVIPYGVCKVGKGGVLKTIEDKPEYNFLVNTGMYILEEKVLRLIPENKKFHMTDLIDAVRDNDGNIRVFPVNENSWIDVGQWDEYKKAIERLQFLK